MYTHVRTNGHVCSLMRRPFGKFVSTPARTRVLINGTSVIKLVCARENALIRCAFDWQSGGCGGRARFRVLCFAGCVQLAAETVVDVDNMQLRERERERSGVCAVHVIRNYAAAAGHLVVLSAACICCLFPSHEMALEPIARALQIILQPPTGN
jgi:hypothetical protein